MTTATGSGYTAVALDRWQELVGLAALLTGSGGVARQAYVTGLRRRVELRNEDAALAYLRRVVVERSRRTRGGRPPLDLDVLPRRQREALVLRHFCGASDAQAAAAMRRGAGEVDALVARALASLDVPAGVMTTRMQAYADRLEVDRPDVGSATVTATRTRRRGTAVRTIAAGVVLALIVVGAVALAQPRGHGMFADGPLPGLQPTLSVTVPAGYRLDDLAAAAGQIWAVADTGGETQSVVLLHGRAGGTLMTVPAYRAPASALLPSIALNGGRAVVETTDEEDVSGGTVPRASLETFDATTAARLSGSSLPVGDDARFVPVLGGSPGAVVLVVSRVTPAGAGTLAFSRLDAGRLEAQREVVHLANDVAPYGDSAAEVSAVAVTAGVPSVAYLEGPPGYLETVDLTTGVLSDLRLTANTSDAGSSSGVVGEVAGELLYESSDGLFAGAVGSPRTERIGDGDNQQYVFVVAGHAYTIVAPNEDTVQQLDPTTFVPTGPIATTRVGEGPVLQLEGGGAEVTLGADAHGLGGTATYYAP